MKTLFVVLSLFVASFALQQKSYEGYQVFLVSPKSIVEIDALKKWELNADIDFWDPLHRNGTPVRIMTSPLIKISFERFLRNNQIKFNIILKNVEDKLKVERAEMNISRIQRLIRKSDNIDFLDFMTLDEINKYLDKIAVEYSKIVNIETIGQSYEGRDIRAVKISLHGKIDDTRPIILIDGTIHAREWISPMVAIKLIYELVENSSANNDVLSNVDWIIVPVLNPDGFVYTFTDDRFWRKTRSIIDNSTCIGVDANRNFNYYWNVEGGASDNPCSLTFRGRMPNSETEIQSISKFMHRYKSTRLYISLHSYGQFMLYPWGFNGVNIDNYDQHNSSAHQAANAIIVFNGTTYEIGNTAQVLYMSSGASKDYAAGPAGINMAFTIELPGGGSQGFDLPPSRIKSVVVETFAGLREFGKYVKNVWGS